MKFSEKLKQAMQELHLNQQQVCGMTGKSKGSVSQYLSGKQIPSEDVQRDIAASLGLDPEYFQLDIEPIISRKTLEDGKIKRMLPEEAAKLMGLGKDSVREGLQQGVFPWGYGIVTSIDPDTGKKRWTYWINAKKFAEIEGVVL